MKGHPLKDHAFKTQILKYSIRAQSVAVKIISAQWLLTVCCGYSGAVTVMHKEHENSAGVQDLSLLLQA